MGQAIETTAGFATNPGAGGAAVTMSTGDSNRVRTFNPAAGGKLIAAVRQGATEGFLQIASPALHDNVRGIRFITTETPTVFAMPREVGQPLVFGDTLSITISGGAAEVDGFALTAWYADLAGISARLHQWADIAGYIEHVKPVEVDFNTNATAMQWTDTTLNTTEDLLNADRSYAVLGYSTDVAVCSIAVKGQETGNLRMGGPGVAATDDTNDYFAFLSEQFNIPAIPVISANNKGSIFVSCVAVATAAAIKSQLWLARLALGFSG